MLTKDQAFDINEFVYKYSNESLWRVGDKLEKILLEIAPNKGKEISKYIVKNGPKAVHLLNDSIFKLTQDLLKVVAEETPELAEA